MTYYAAEYDTYIFSNKDWYSQTMKFIPLKNLQQSWLLCKVCKDEFTPTFLKTFIYKDQLISYMFCSSITYFECKPEIEMLINLP